MDNAAKALLIAGGVLIAVLVASVGIYLMQNMAQSSERFYKMMEQSEIDKFNEKFMKYDGREDLTMQEVVTIMNLARDNNKKNGKLVESDYNYIKVKGTGTLLVTDISTNMNKSDTEYESYTQQILKNYINADAIRYIDDPPKLRKITYKCKITKSTDTGLVKEIEIEEIDNEP